MLKNKQLGLLMLFFILTSMFVFAFNTLSVSPNVDFQDGKYWVLLISESLDSDYAVAKSAITKTIDNEQIKNGDKYASSDVTIKTQPSDMYCKYSFNTQSLEPVKTKQVKFAREIWFWDNDKDDKECGYNTYLARAKPFSYMLYSMCIGENLAGYSVPIQKDEFIFKENIDITANGKTENLCVSNNAQITGCSSSVSSPDGLASIQWVGNFNKGRECPDAIESKVEGYKVGTTWKIVDSKAVDTWKTYDEAGFDGCLQREFFTNELSMSEVERLCVKDYNNKVYNIESGVNWKPQWSVPTTSAKISGSNILIDVAPTFSAPTFTMKLAVSWLGLINPVCDPTITQFNKVNDFGEGKGGFLNLNIFNNGKTGTGSCSYSLTCNAPISAVDSNGAVQIGAGKSSSLQLEVEGTPGQSKQCGTCTVTVFDTEKTTQYRKSKSTDICVNQLSICNANEKRCLNNNVETCENNKFVISQVCTQTQVCRTENDVKCVEKDAAELKTCPDILVAGMIPVPNVICMLKLWFKTYIQNWIWLIGSIISLLLGGITFFLLKSLTLKLGIKQDKTINTMLTIMSIMATVIYALIFVWQWWIGLILLILLIVLKFVI